MRLPRQRLSTRKFADQCLTLAYMFVITIVERPAAVTIPLGMERGIESSMDQV